jgi:hypothetical protein
MTQRAGASDPPMDARQTFLLEMYRQMFADINRHMTVVWQSVSVVIGAFAIFSLVEKQVMSLDMATSLIIFLCAWLLAHMLDAAYWYNRNLVIIANIERQFLNKDDAKHIQYYFVKHRSGGNRMISYFKIQTSLGVGVATLVILLHLIDRVMPGIHQSLSHFEPQRALPYISLAGSLIVLLIISKDRDDSYKTFLKNSPGLPMDAQGIYFGPGHTVDED